MSMRGTGPLRGGGTARDGRSPPSPAWPGEPSGLTAEGLDIEALAHVLANTCRWGGRTRRFYSFAQRAVVASEEIESLGGLAPEDRRRLALRALIAEARIAWLGDAQAPGPASARAADRARRGAEQIDRAVQDAAGLDGEASPDQADLLRFVGRMADAAERRDLPEAGFGENAGAAFPPLKRRIRPLEPHRAARLWLDRYRALTAPAAGAGGTPASNDGEKNDGAQ